MLVFGSPDAEAKAFSTPAGATPFTSTANIALFTLPVTTAGPITPPGSQQASPCGFVGTSLFKSR